MRKPSDRVKGRGKDDALSALRAARKAELKLELDAIAVDASPRGGLSGLYARLAAMRREAAGPPVALNEGVALQDADQEWTADLAEKIVGGHESRLLAQDPLAALCALADAGPDVCQVDRVLRLLPELSSVCLTPGSIGTLSQAVPAIWIHAGLGSEANAAKLRAEADGPLRTQAGLARFLVGAPSFGDEPGRPALREVVLDLALDDAKSVWSAAALAWGRLARSDDQLLTAMGAALSYKSLNHWHSEVLQSARRGVRERLRTEEWAKMGLTARTSLASTISDVDPFRGLDPAERPAPDAPGWDAAAIARIRERHRRAFESIGAHAPSTVLTTDDGDPLEIALLADLGWRDAISGAGEQSAMGRSRSLQMRLPSAHARRHALAAAGALASVDGERMIPLVEWGRPEADKQATPAWCVRTVRASDEFQGVLSKPIDKWDQASACIALRCWEEPAVEAGPSLHDQARLTLSEILGERRDPSSWAILKDWWSVATASDTKAPEEYVRAMLERSRTGDHDGAREARQYVVAEAQRGAEAGLGALLAIAAAESRGWASREEPVPSGTSHGSPFTRAVALASAQQRAARATTEGERESALDRARFLAGGGTPVAAANLARVTQRLFAETMKLAEPGPHPSPGAVAWLELSPEVSVDLLGRWATSPTVPDEVRTQAIRTSKTRLALTAVLRKRGLDVATATIRHLGNGPDGGDAGPTDRKDAAIILARAIDEWSLDDAVASALSIPRGGAGFRYRDYVSRYVRSPAARAVFRIVEKLDQRASDPSSGLESLRLAVEEARGSLKELEDEFPKAFLLREVRTCLEAFLPLLAHEPGRTGRNLSGHIAVIEPEPSIYANLAQRLEQLVEVPDADEHAQPPEAREALRVVEGLEDQARKTGATAKDLGTAVEKARDKLQKLKEKYPNAALLTAVVRRLEVGSSSTQPLNPARMDPAGPHEEAELTPLACATLARELRQLLEKARVERCLRSVLFEELQVSARAVRDLGGVERTLFGLHRRLEADPREASLELSDARAQLVAIAQRVSGTPLLFAGIVERLLRSWSASLDAAARELAPLRDHISTGNEDLVEAYAPFKSATQMHQGTPWGCLVGDPGEERLGAACPAGGRALGARHAPVTASGLPDSPRMLRAAWLARIRFFVERLAHERAYRLIRGGPGTESRVEEGSKRPPRYVTAVVQVLGLLCLAPLVAYVWPFLRGVIPTDRYVTRVALVHALVPATAILLALSYYLVRTRDARDARLELLHPGLATSMLFAGASMFFSYGQWDFLFRLGDRGALLTCGFMTLAILSQISRRELGGVARQMSWSKHLRRATRVFLIGFFQAWIVSLAFTWILGDQMVADKQRWLDAEAGRVPVLWSNVKEQWNEHLLVIPVRVDLPFGRFYPRMQILWTFALFFIAVFLEIVKNATKHVSMVGARRKS